MTLPIIPFAEGEALLNWLELTEALAAGHQLPKAEIGDTFLYRDPESATVFPGNPGKGKPMVNGGVCLYSDADGMLEALVDFHLVTKWKTAGDSLLGALRLARADSERILIVGAGTVGASLCEAFAAGFPQAKQAVWNRTTGKAQALADAKGVDLAEDLESAVRAADIIVSATMSTEPVIKGEWLRPGQHLNLIGAYRPDMREADDAALLKSQVYVDSFDTTLDHIGELKTPLAEGVLQRADVLADFYALDAFRLGRADEITLFKNGGGAHLDLMTSRYILDKWRAA